MVWNFQDSYTNLPSIFYKKVKPDLFNNKKLILFNKDLANEIGLNFDKFDENEICDILLGKKLTNKEFFSQAYAGHQFGHFTILGDGRALLLGEHITKNNQRLDIQLKGSGRTPYSRNGDGKAAMGPMIREYIVSEAMHNLGIPSTRALAVIKTGENIIRESTWFLVKTSKINNGKEIPAIMDPKETYLVMVKTITKTPKADKAAGG